jgi:DNA-binding transcriptional LysR family regulator
MEWTQLRALVAVARHGSFSGAAAELGLTQPGVSRQVQKVERELGVPLFVRRRGGVTLTAAGRLAVAYADEVLARHEQFVRALRAEPAPVAGELQIAASTTPGEFIVPGLVAAFRQQYPAVRPRVTISDTTAVVADLHQGAADVGFVGARVRGRGLRYEAVADDEVVLAVPAGHRFAGRGRITLDELAGERFVEREGGSGTLLSVHRILAARGRRLPPHHVVMELSTTQAIVSAVEGGYGLGWVSALALAGRDRARVGAVRLEDLPLRRPLYMATARAGAARPVADAFTAWVREQRRQPAADAEAAHQGLPGSSDAPPVATVTTADRNPAGVAGAVAPRQDAPWTPAGQARGSQRRAPPDVRPEVDR